MSLLSQWPRFNSRWLKFNFAIIFFRNNSAALNKIVKIFLFFIDFGDYFTSFHVFVDIVIHILFPWNQRQFCILFFIEWRWLFALRVMQSHLRNWCFLFIVWQLIRSFRWVFNNFSCILDSTFKNCRIPRLFLSLHTINARNTLFHFVLIIIFSFQI